MAPSDPEPSALAPTFPTPELDGPRSATNDSKTLVMGTGRLLLFACSAALLAGVVSLLAGEVILSRYQGDLLPALKISPSAEDMRRLRAARLYSPALTFTALGDF